MLLRSNRLAAVSVLVVATAGPTGLLAKSVPYSCTVVSVHDVDAKGHLVPQRGFIYRVGQQFQVDRQSGQQLDWRVAEPEGRVTVIDPGDAAGQAFRVLRVMGLQGRKSAHYLEVDEFEKGPTKPFRLVAGHRLISGYCQ